MNKSKKTKNLLILLVLIAIVAIAVGYATMAQNLVLNGSVKTLSVEDWDIHFATDPVPTMTPDTSEEHDGVFDQAFNIDTGALTGTFAVTLAPGASINYDLQVKNDGRLHGILDGSPVISGTNAYISCTVTPNPSNTEIYTDSSHPAGVVDRYTVTITCADMDELPADALEATVAVTFNYVQAHTN